MVMIAHEVHAPSNPVMRKPVFPDGADPSGERGAGIVGHGLPVWHHCSVCGD